MKKQVALEDMYAIVNKQQKKKCNEDTLPNTVERVYYNAVKKECALEYEEVAPKIPPYTIEKLYTAVVKKPKSNANQTEEVPF